MLSKDLEAKVIAAIVAKFTAVGNLPPYQIIGAWQPSAADAVRGVEDPSAVATIAVALGLPQVPTFTDPSVTFNGGVNLTVRLEQDATGTAFGAFAAALDDLFRGWQADTYQQAFTALDLTNLSVDEVSVSGGVPALNQSARTCSVSFAFTLQGSTR